MALRDKYWFKAAAFVRAEKRADPVYPSGVRCEFTAGDLDKIESKRANLIANRAIARSKGGEA